MIYRKQLHFLIIEKEAIWQQSNFSSMELQKYDAYALKKYAFTLSKTNSYFTIYTIALSFLIVFTSIMVNMPTVSHLWLKRQELLIQLSESLTFSDPLTSTLVCYKDNNGKNVTASARIINHDLTTNDFMLMNEDMVRSIRPDIADKLQNNFGCFDIKGFSFSQKNPDFYVQVLSTNATLFLQSTTPNDIIAKNDTTFIRLSKGMGRLLRIIRSIDTDTLMPNTAPIITNTFYSDDNSSQVFQGAFSFPFKSNFSRFLVRMFVPIQFTGNTFYNFSIMTLTITRFDIGYIIGTILSWISSIAMILAIFITPIMEKQLSLNLAESLFELQPQNRKPNIFKYIIAEFKKGYYLKQELYIKLCERLQLMMNVGFMMKVLKTTKKVCNVIRKQPEIIACGCSFDKNQQEDLGVHLYSDRQNQKKFVYFDEETKEESKSMTLCKSLLKSVDFGSENVSLFYPYNGYGTKISLCLTLIFIGGFIAFLILFNFIQFSTTVDISNQITTDTLSYTIQTNEIVIVVNENAQILASLLDGNYNKIENIVLTKGSKCLNNLTQTQISQMKGYGQYYFCLNESITLSNSISTSESVSLYIDNINMKYNPTRIFHFSSPSPSQYYKPIDNVIKVSPIYDPATIIYYQQELILTNIINNDNDEGTYAQFTPLKQRSNQFNSLLGINIILRHAKTVISSTDNTLFDIVQSIWGLAIVCFTVILYKITKYINIYKKQQVLTPIRADYRQNVCIFLSRLNSLNKGNHHSQLLHMKLYMKQPYVFLT